MAVAANMTPVSLYLHTIGTFYRLLSGEVLPATVDNVLYLDVNVIVLANLEGMWQRYVVRDDNIYFQWGVERCAGFMMLRPHKMEEVWKLYQQVPEAILRRVLRRRPVPDDQTVFRAVRAAFPRVVARLPPEYDISAADGPWKGKQGSEGSAVLLQHRPNGAGMMHFNGGGSSQEAYFNRNKEHELLKEPIWGDLAKYYVNLPWPWARFILSNSVVAGRAFKVRIQHKVQPQ